jgi:hypothetical protein
MSVNYVGVGVYLGAVIRQCRRPGTLPAPFCSPPTQATSAVRNTAPVAKVTLLWLGERRGRVQFLKVCWCQKEWFTWWAPNFWSGTERIVHRFARTGMQVLWLRVWTSGHVAWPWLGEGGVRISYPCHRQILYISSKNVCVVKEIYFF